MLIQLIMSRAHLRKALLTALMGLLIIVTGASMPARTDSDQLGIRLTPQQLANLRNGDLVFRKAPGLPSDRIVRLDGKSEYSHVGLIHKVGDRVTVIHSAFDRSQMKTGVCEQDLNGFLAGIPVAAIYRLPDDTGSRADGAIRIALDLVGTPFDFSLNTDKPDQLYCTELPWVAYKRVGINLLDGQLSELDLPLLGHVHVILPSDLARSSKLFRVMYLKAHS